MKRKHFTGISPELYAEIKSESNNVPKFFRQLLITFRPEVMLEDLKYDSGNQKVISITATEQVCKIAEELMARYEVTNLSALYRSLAHTYFATRGDRAA
jgi:hypothetical protein